MSVRLILQFNKTPSHALVNTAFWVRLLIEIESPSGQGHTIGAALRLRKCTSAIHIITAIEIEQRQFDPVRTQRYLDACAWWLRRAPFSVARLPVQLVAHGGCSESLAHVEGWRVAQLHLIHVSLCVRLQPIAHLFPRLEALCISGVGGPQLDVVDATLLATLSSLRHLRLNNVRLPELDAIPVQHLERLDLAGSADVRSIESLSSAQHLQEIDASGTSVHNVAPLRRCRTLRKLAVRKCPSLQDLSPLAGAPHLVEIDASRSGAAVLAGLHTCPSLRKATFVMCGSLEDLSSLAWAPALEHLNASGSSVSSLMGLHTCPCLKTVNFSWCTRLYDLSPLAGACCLEKIEATKSAVTTLTGLSKCCRLNEVIFVECTHLTDLSPLAGASALEVINAAGSGVTTLMGLNTCKRLRKVNLSLCASLSDLSTLAGAFSLEEIKAADSGAINVQGLHSCPRLVNLDLRGTPADSLRAKLTRSAHNNCVSF